MEGSTQVCARIAFLCFISLLDGMVDSCLGPALRDLQCIFNVPLQKVSLFQLVITAGRVMGSLLFLKARGRCNIYGVAATTMTMASCLLAVVPVVSTFWMALGLSGAVGLAHGIAMHAKIVLSGELCKQLPASIHIINLAVSAGSGTGPLIISPFLSDNVAHGNSTEPAFQNDNITFLTQHSTVQLRENICYNFKSELLFGFIIIASLGVVVFSGHLLAQRIFREEINTNQQKETSGSTINIIDGVFLILMIIYTTICGPMIFVYGQFLPTFGIHCKLYADTKQMTKISLSFYICITFGRLFGTFGSFVIKQTVLINVCTAGAIMTSVMLIYVSEIDFIWMWIVTSILAGVCSPLFSAMNTWALNVNKHRPILYGVSSTADMAGYSVMSLLTGQLMAYLFVQILNYIMVSVLLLQLVLTMFLYLTVIVSKHVTSRNQGYSYIE